jgi:aspartyl/asparaginyl beta-hydroxylase (cupin superfamily)
MFFDPNLFPFTAKLSAHWQSIRAEVDRLDLTHFEAWPERFLYDHGWNVFGLYGVGQKLHRNCDLCPETTRLVEAIPGLMMAGFSRLEGGTHIRPHVGYTPVVLRCHLGLIVPDSNRCRLRVGTETRSWQEGACLVFDDTMEHEAWNDADTQRVILLVDFLRA